MTIGKSCDVTSWSCSRLCVACVILSDMMPASMWSMQHIIIGRDRDRLKLYPHLASASSDACVSCGLELLMQVSMTLALAFVIFLVQPV